MLTFGSSPILECSSKGDRRFSAFYARIKRYDNRSIEELYQAAKVFPDGSTNLSIKEAKGKVCVNIESLRGYYTRLWEEYLNENPHLYIVLSRYNGCSDIFGQKGNVCQAGVLYQILCHMKESRNA